METSAPITLTPSPPFTVAPRSCRDQSAFDKNYHVLCIVGVHRVQLQSRSWIPLEQGLPCLTAVALRHRSHLWNGGFIVPSDASLGIGIRDGPRVYQQSLYVR